MKKVSLREFTALRFILFTMAVICLASPVVAANQVVTFSSLPKGDLLQIAFMSSGCFHFVSYELKFRVTPEPIVGVTRVEPKWSDDRKRFTSTNRVNLGNLTLAKTDLQGLDRLLAFYRSGPRSGCTTVDKISISQIHRGITTATEQFTDGSCSYDRKDLIRITDLVARLQNPK
jgi:hypothetical protein